MNFSILVDMNLSPDWVPVLTAAGHAAVHSSTIGDIRAIDQELVQCGRDNGHIVLTHDLDFGTILAQTQASCPSVVIIRANDPKDGPIQARVFDALGQCGNELAAGALVVVDTGRSRVRIRPI